MVGSPRVLSNTEMNVIKMQSNSVSCSVPMTVGMRIECSNDFGTVKYVGEVQGYKGLWLGIDWDDPTRGKHDGTVANVQYFRTRYPTSGSFVRPQKINTGVTIETALKQRYGKEEDELRERLDKQNILYIQKCINAPFLEMVGFDKVNDQQSNFSELRIVSLRGQFVNDTSPPDALSYMCPNIEDLDLSLNLISNWDLIIRICENLKHLRLLNVSDNILKLSDNISAHKLNNLKTLICGKMNLTWPDLIKLSELWPQIEEMRAPFNNITNFNTDSDISLKFPHLASLDFDSNMIESWDELLKLGTLPNLEKLILTNAGLKRIYFNDCPIGNKTKLFKTLKKLVISENLIDNWDSITELEKLQNFSDLKFLKNPVLETETPDTCFQLIVAKISNLKILNGQKIAPDERRGAEYDYLKKYGKEWLLSENNPQTRSLFIEKHPTYPKLVEVYGAPEESELVTIDTSLKSNLIEVEIVDLKTNKTIVKKLPANMLVQKLNNFIQKVFKIDSTPRLSYISKKQPNFEREMDNDYKDLKFYSLQSGDKVFVNL